MALATATARWIRSRRRNLAIALLLLDTGIRAGELLRLTPDDLDLDAGTADGRMLATRLEFTVTGPGSGGWRPFLSSGWPDATGRGRATQLPQTLLASLGTTTLDMTTVSSLSLEPLGGEAVCD